MKHSIREHIWHEPQRLAQPLGIPESRKGWIALFMVLLVLALLLVAFLHSTSPMRVEVPL